MIYVHYKLIKYLVHEYYIPYIVKRLLLLCFKKKYQNIYTNE